MNTNKLSLEIISLEEYKNDLNSLNVSVPVWIDPVSISCYENKKIVRVNLDDEALLYYVIPFYNLNGAAYDNPLLLLQHNLELLMSFLHYL